MIQATPATAVPTRVHAHAAAPRGTSATPSSPPSDILACATQSPRTLSTTDAARVLFQNGSIDEATWKAQIDDFAAFPPTPGPGGTVLVADSCGYPSHLFALDASTGKEVWKTIIGGHLDVAPFIHENRTIIAGTRGKTVLALDAATGHHQWRFDVQGQIARAPVVGLDGTLFYSTLEDEVWAVNPDSGDHKLVFKKDLVDKYPQSYSPSLAVGKDGTLLVGSVDNHLYAIDPATGEEKWAFSTQSAITTTPVVGDDGTIYVAQDSWTVYALDGKTGARIWEKTTTPGYSIQEDMSLTADGKLLVTAGSSLYCFDAATGELQWESEDLISRASRSSLVPQDDLVYLSSYQGVHAVDMESGKTKWLAKTDKNTRIAGQVAPDGLLYATCQDGRVLALDPATGEPCWSHQAEGELYTDPTVTADHRLLFSSTDGQVYSFDRSPENDAASASEQPPAAIETHDGFIVVGGVKVPVRQ